jgi:hypothetical protein
VKVRAYRVRGISAAISFATPSASATPVAAPGDPLQELFDEIDALSRKRIYKHVPNKPA